MGVFGQFNLFYFGSIGGGVWKMKDGGQIWENIFDGFFGGFVGVVVVSIYDFNVIYVGGGEKIVCGNVFFGYGIWKSVDGGKIWEQKGFKKFCYIGCICIYFCNLDIVYVVVMGDLFKSLEEWGVYCIMDGGDIWECIFFVNVDVGVVDFLFDFVNLWVVYVFIWCIWCMFYSLESGGEGFVFWKSIDSGMIWENFFEKEGFLEGLLGIIGVVVLLVNVEWVWVLVEVKDGGVLCLEDGGEIWLCINDSCFL